MTEEEKEVTVENEFDLVKNAIYTDPEDQSAWLYELWLIGRGTVDIEMNTSTLRCTLSITPNRDLFDLLVHLICSFRGEENFGSWRQCHFFPSSGDRCGIR